MDLKEKLIVQRKQKGLSQVQLAETIHVTRQAVSRWEVGDAVPSIDNLKRLSELYGLPMEYFLKDSMEEPERPEVSANKENQKNQIKRWDWRLWVILTAGITILLLVVVLTAMVRENESESGSVQIDTNIGVDVSSDWGKEFDIHEKW